MSFNEIKMLAISNKIHTKKGSIFATFIPFKKRIQKFSNPG
jgi:hypothetical protein